MTFQKTVDYVDISKFMGKWYVQAGRFTFMEKDVHNAIEIYQWDEEKEQIKISFDYRQGGFDGKKKSIPQTGSIYNHQTNAHWKVSPIWPLKFDYLVIALAEDYSWCAIGVPSQKYLWIMTRESNLTEVEFEKILSKVKETGYSIEDLSQVPHQYSNY